MALTQEQKAMKQRLHKINRRILKIAKEAGTESTYYQAYETPMLDSSKGKGFGGMQGVRNRVKVNGHDVYQFNLDKRTIDMMLADKNAKHWLSKFEAMPTFAKLKPSILKAYESTFKGKTDGMTKAQERDAIRKQLSFERKVRDMFDRLLAAIYDDVNYTGEEPEIIERIRKSSKGRWSSNQFYEDFNKEMPKYLNDINTESITESKSIAEDMEDRGWYDSAY